MIKRILQITFLVIVFWYLLKDIELSELVYAVKGYSIFGLILTMLLIGLSYLVLAYRWSYMTNNTCNLAASFEASVITGFLNMILPAKAGEFSKVLYLKQYYKYEVNNSLSLLFIERFFDLIVLAMFLIIVNIFYIDDKYLQSTLIILALFIITFLILLKINILYKIIKLIPCRIFNVFGRKIIRNINFKLKGDMLTKVVFTTILLWLIYFFTYFIFFGFTVNFNLSFYQIFIFFIVSTVALAVPLTPGGIGTFQASIVLIGTMVGIDSKDSLVSGIVLYFLMIFVDFVMFNYVLVKKDISMKDLVKR